jgi:hypothetical protein
LKAGKISKLGAKSGGTTGARGTTSDHVNPTRNSSNMAVVMSPPESPDETPNPIAFRSLGKETDFSVDPIPFKLNVEEGFLQQRKEI